MEGANVHQSSPTPANCISTKIPDPPTLTDGKEPRFEDWLLLMSQKLAANADHFDTSQLRMAYVASRCEGKARKHITPRMRDDSMNPYTDSKDMLDHLKMIYNDPNRVATAKHQFRQLYMRVSDKFHDFLSEFLYLAAEAGVMEDDWKDELYHKLTTELQKLCISDSIKDGTFQEFSNAVSQTASRLEVINHRTQKNNPFSTPRTRNNNSNQDRAKDTSLSVNPTSNIKKESKIDMTDDNRNKLMKEGKCFICFSHGHLARDCPKKKLDSDLQNLERNPDNEDMGKV